MKVVHPRILDGSLKAFEQLPALSAFIDLVGEDEEKLDQLEAMIREKKREKNRKGK